MVQLQVINKILDTQNSSILVSNNLNEDYFSDYLTEYKFIRNHIDQYGKVPDTESFLSHFPNFDIIKVTESDSYLLEELHNDRNTRMLAATFNNIRDLLESGKTDDAMKLYINAAQNVTKAIHIDSVDLLTDRSRYDAYVERSRDFSKYFIRTGWKELDDLINGWDRLEELATIVARPGCSKTWALLKTATEAAKQGLTVGIYSGEMTDKKVGYRIDSLLSHISNRKILQGNIEVQNDYKKYIDSIQEKVPGKIKILTPAMLGQPAGVLALRAFIENDNLDILCIDQHSLLEDDRKAKTPVEKAANISKDLKNLQVLTQKPIIAVSQQNREKAEGIANVSLISQADRIGQDSTTVIFLEVKDNILTMTLAKSRDSISGKQLHYVLDLDKGLYTYMPGENDALKGAGSDELRAKYDSETPDGGDVF